MTGAGVGSRAAGDGGPDGVRAPEPVSEERGELSAGAGPSFGHGDTGPTTDPVLHGQAEVGTGAEPSVGHVDRSPTAEPPHRAAWISLLVGLAIGLVVVGRMLEPLVSVLLLALVAVGLLHPVYARVLGWFRGQRALASFTICAGLLVVLLAPLFLTGQAVSREAIAIYELTTTQLTTRNMAEFVAQRQPQLDRVNRFLGPFGGDLTAEDVEEVIGTAGARLGSFFYREGVAMAGYLVRFVVGFILWVLVVFYLLVDGERLREWFQRTLPLPLEQQDLVVHRFSDMAGSIVLGNGIAGVIQGVVGGLMFAALDIPGPALWGLVMGILAFIPVIGISFVYIPTTLILLLIGDTERALILFVVLAVVSTVVEYWLKPIFVGRRAQIHTLLVFISLIGGVDAFGAVGLLLGPLMMTAFLTLASIFQERYRPYVRSPSAPSPPSPPDAPTIPERQSRDRP